MENDPLLSPFTIKGLTLRNRIVSTSHEPAFGEDGLPTDRYRAYHVEKARGGVGLTMMGGSAVVSRESTPAFKNLQLWKDEAEPLLRRMADEVHSHGAAIMTQLTHLGHRTTNFAGEWLPALSASAVREPAHRSFTKAAESWDLDRIVDDFVSTAQRCEAAGLDGVELYAAGHLLDAFWSPYWNHRDDEYGGSYENRMRFPLRVVNAIRQGVGDRFILGIRMSFDESREGGVGPGESVRIANDVVAAGVDIISILKGSIETDAACAVMIPPMGTPSAPHLAFAGQVKRQVPVPVMHAAKIADIETARYAIRENLLDLVGMTRAILADPELPNKLRLGLTDRIRPCVGANMCIDAIYTNGSAYCIHNPSAGRELELPVTLPRADQARRVAVVGAGPAGLEAGRVLAERGHDVTIFEAAGAAGGQLLLAGKAPRRRDLQAIIDWRVQELARLNVTVKYNHLVDADELRDAAWDTILIATGGVPAALSEPGGHLAIDTWDVLSGAVTPRGSVLVYDDHGGHQALDAVENLAARGLDVELVTPERTISPDVGSFSAAGYLATLAEYGVRITPVRRLQSISRADGRLTVTFATEATSATEQRVVDCVVAEVGTDPVCDLYDELVGESTNRGETDLGKLLSNQLQDVHTNPDGRFQLFRLGDAVASRNVHAAILDANRLCRGI